MKPLPAIYPAFLKYHFVINGVSLLVGEPSLDQMHSESSPVFPPDHN
jgi:hypothetical protein